MEVRAFADLINFSRSSVASYFNAAGLLVQAAVNEPRFEYDPATLLPLGLLLEPQRQNTFTYSQDFGNAAWTKTRSTVTVGQTAPDGTNTAYTVTVADAGGSNYLYRQKIAWTAGITYSLSVYAKAGNQPIVYLQMLPTAFGGTNQVNFDLTGNGSFVVVGGGSAGTVARIEKLANGWFRLSMTSTCTVTQPAANWIVFSQPVTLNSSYIAWGAQMEIGYGATSYIPTTAAAVIRNIDTAYCDTSAWLRNDEGTLYTEAVSYGGQTFVASLGTIAPSGPRIANWRNIAGSVNSQVVADDLSVSFSATPVIAGVGVLMKHATTYRHNDFQASVNGVVSLVDTSGEVPTPSRLSLGARGIVGDAMNGHLRRLDYYPYRLSASELQAITT